MPGLAVCLKILVSFRVSNRIYYVILIQLQMRIFLVAELAFHASHFSKKKNASLGLFVAVAGCLGRVDCSARNPPPIPMLLHLGYILKLHWCLPVCVDRLLQEFRGCLVGGVKV
jgi:hypothetical protein